MFCDPVNSRYTGGTFFGGKKKKNVDYTCMGDTIFWGAMYWWAKRTIVKFHLLSSSLQYITTCCFLTEEHLGDLTQSQLLNKSNNIKFSTHSAS